MFYNNTSVVHYIKPVLYISNYPAFGQNTFQIIDTLNNFTYGTSFRIILEDTCNLKISSLTYTAPPFLFTVRVWYIDTAACTGNLGAILDFYHNVQPGNLNTQQTAKYPLSFTVKDIDSNKIVQIDTIQVGLINITPKVPGRNYLISIKDGCGQIYSFDTIWPVPGVVSEVDIPFISCIDSTGAREIRMYGFGPGLKLEILSGPKYLHSTKAHYAYLDSIVYPQTITHFLSNLTYVGTFYVVDFRYIRIKNLPEGTYQYRITDSCGHIITGSFAVIPDQLTILNHTLSFRKGCLGQNILGYNIKCNLIGRSRVMIYDHNHVKKYDQGANTEFYRDSITSVDAGQYTFYINYENGYSYTTINENIKNCWTAYDTVDIPVYQRPAVSSFSIIYCNGNRYAELHPDSSRGIPPYQYEVISGPKLYPLQTSNVFDFIPIGDYVSRIVDACGNSNIMNFGVDTLIFPPITKIGSSCIGGNVILFYPSSPFFTYHWTRPDGTVFIGDTMGINGVTYADTGLYQITRYVNINNCKDSFNTVYRLESNTEYTFDTSICEGQTFTLNNHTYTNSGTYADTILSASCDTIYTLNLTVLPKSIINIDTTICIGQGIQIGNHFYNQPGTYTDTLIARNGCDSIITLKIILVQAIDLAITASATVVAPGDTIQLNAISTQPLTYNWTSIAFISNPIIQNPTALINQPSWIYLDVVMRNGCKNADSIFIDIFNNCDAENVFIPNSFTPNGDGINDVFKVRSKILQSGNLMIYDRWGNKVFESDDLTKGWDGIYKGQPAQEEAYGYYFEGTCINGEQIKLKGNVTLLR